MDCPAPGFGKRLKTAMQANGIYDVGMFAEKIGVSRATVYRLLASDRPKHVDACLLFHICEALQFSGRWLLWGTGHSALRQSLSPDESWLIDSYRHLDDAQKELLSAAVHGLVR